MTGRVIAREAKEDNTEESWADAPESCKTSSRLQLPLEENLIMQSPGEELPRLSCREEGGRDRGLVCVVRRRQAGRKEAETNHFQRVEETRNFEC